MLSWKIFPVIIIGWLLVACGGAKPAPAPTPTPLTPPLAIDASNLYTTKCAVCHGPDRQGISGLGPALTPQSLAARSDAEIKNTITNGKPNTAMPPWKDILSPAEIEALVKLVKTAP